MVFTVGVDVASFLHPQEEEPVESPMAVEAKPAALPGKQLGKEHGPIEPSDQAKGLCEGQSDSGLETKVCHEDKVASVASCRESVTVTETPLKDTSPSLAGEGVSSLGLHVFAADKSSSSFLQCFPRLLHLLFFPFISMTALVIMLEECVADNMIA